MTLGLAQSRVSRIAFRNLGGRGFREMRVEIWADLADGRYRRNIRISISASGRRLHTLPPQSVASDRTERVAKEDTKQVSVRASVLDGQ